MSENLLERTLPKWPQMIVTGRKLSSEQALEIIRRTDSFFLLYTGNDIAFNENVLTMIGYPHEISNNDPRCLNSDGTTNMERKLQLFDEYWEKKQNWANDWGLIPTNFVKNSWISCSFIGGPHGWCHPDGQIGFCNNIGKWPNVSEVYYDWKTLAAEFPYIEIEATLMDREEYEDNSKPIISFLIRDGNVELIDPQIRNIHEEFGRTIMKSNDMMTNVLRIFSCGPDAEHAISLDIIRSWAERFREQYPNHFSQKH